jgi:hypothetical protein
VQGKPPRGDGHNRCTEGDAGEDERHETLDPRIAQVMENYF